MSNTVIVEFNEVDYKRIIEHCRVMGVKPSDLVREQALDTLAGEDFDKELAEIVKDEVEDDCPDCGKQLETVEVQCSCGHRLHY